MTSHFPVSRFDHVPFDSLADAYSDLARDVECQNRATWNVPLEPLIFGLEDESSDTDAPDHDSDYKMKLAFKVSDFGRACLLRGWVLPKVVLALRQLCHLEDGVQAYPSRRLVDGLCRDLDEENASWRWGDFLAAGIGGEDDRELMFGELTKRSGQFNLPVGHVYDAPLRLVESSAEALCLSALVNERLRRKSGVSSAPVTPRVGVEKVSGWTIDALERVERASHPPEKDEKMGPVLAAVRVAFEELAEASENLKRLEIAEPLKRLPHQIAESWALSSPDWIKRLLPVSSPQGSARRKPLRSADRPVRRRKSKNDQERDHRMYLAWKDARAECSEPL